MTDKNNLRPDIKLWPSRLEYYHNQNVLKELVRTRNDIELQTSSFLMLYVASYNKLVQEQLHMQVLLNCH